MDIDSAFGHTHPFAHLFTQSVKKKNLGSLQFTNVYLSRTEVLGLGSTPGQQGSVSALTTWQATFITRKTGRGHTEMAQLVRLGAHLVGAEFGSLGLLTNKKKMNLCLIYVHSCRVSLSLPAQAKSSGLNNCSFFFFSVRMRPTPPWRAICLTQSSQTQM